jgi:Tol biopolymer transport system component
VHDRQHIRRLAGLAIVLVVVLALAGTAAAGLSRQAVPPPGISIVGWDSSRGGTAVWRGVARVREERFLPGARRPTLSPTAGGVAYVKHTRRGFDVYHTGTYGGFEQRLAQVSGPPPLSLAFSPDGQLIAFPSAKGIETVSIRGVRRTIPLPAAWRGSFLDGLVFSPDGALLAFSRTWRDARTGAPRNELGVVGRNGRGARSLVRNPRPAEGRYRAVFAPDGRRILFTAAGGSLASVAVAGGAVRSLTSPSVRDGERMDTDPVFSRDGAWTAFTRWRSARGGGGSDVYVMRVSGAELRRVTTTPAPTDPDATGAGSVALAWSPDGTRLLTRRYDRLATADVATGAAAELGRIGHGLAVGSVYWNP